MTYVESLRGQNRIIQRPRADVEQPGTSTSGFPARQRFARHSTWRAAGV